MDVAAGLQAGRRDGLKPVAYTDVKTLWLDERERDSPSHADGIRPSCLRNVAMSQ